MWCTVVLFVDPISFTCTSCLSVSLSAWFNSCFLHCSSCSPSHAVHPAWMDLPADCWTSGTRRKLCSLDWWEGKPHHCHWNHGNVCCFAFRNMSSYDLQCICFGQNVRGIHLIFVTDDVINTQTHTRKKKAAVVLPQPHFPHFLIRLMTIRCALDLRYLPSMWPLRMPCSSWKDPL